MYIPTLTNTKAAFAYLNDGFMAYFTFNGNANNESWNGNNRTVNSLRIGLGIQIGCIVLIGNNRVMSAKRITF